MIGRRTSKRKAAESGMQKTMTRVTKKIKLEQNKHENVDDETPNSGNSFKELVKLEIPVKKEQPSSDTGSHSESEDDICDYEKKRQQNLKDNAAFLAQIELLEAKADVSSMLTTKKKATPSHRGLHDRKVKEILPRRSSLRLQKVEPDGVTPSPELPTIPQYEQEEHPRKPSESLQMTEHIKNIEDEDKDLHNEFLESLKNISLPHKKNTLKCSEEDSYVKSLKSLSLTEETVAKVVPQRIFSIAVHPSEDKLLAVAGDKWGRLGLWDVESKASNQGVFCYTPHSRPISCSLFNPFRHNEIFTCSYDGTLRCCNFEKNVFDEVYATPEDHGIRLNCIDFLSEHSLIVSDSDGDVHIIDTRTDSSKAQHIYQVHNKSTKCVSVHPVKRDFFVTSATDGTLCSWDVRQMSAKKSQSLSCMAQSKMIDSAYFSPLTGNTILSTSMENTIKLYNSEDVGNLKLKASVRHNNQTGRWLSNFKATWHPQREDIFVVGSMDRPRRIEIFNSSMKIVKTLADEDHLNSVCSLNVIHPTRNIIVGGNSSGRVHIFQ